MTAIRHFSTVTGFACVALWIVLTGVSARMQVRAPLTDAEIDEAIRVGVAGGIAPYPMYPTGYPLPSAVGKEALALGSPAPAVVYTPFVRVALHAKAAYERGTILTRGDVASAALDPSVWIGFTWNVCCGDEDRFKDGLLEILAVFDRAAIRMTLGGQAYVRARDDPRAQPAWTRQGTAPLRSLGIQPPEQIDAVAAFDVSISTSATEFRVARYTAAPNAVSGRPDIAFAFVAPVPGDPRTWR